MLTNHATIDTPHGIVDVYWTEDDIVVTWRTAPDAVATTIDIPSPELQAERIKKVFGDRVD